LRSASVCELWILWSAAASWSLDALAEEFLSREMSWKGSCAAITARERHRPGTMRDNPKVPHNLHAERAVLGAVILDPPMLETVTGVLEERDFFTSENQCIFRRLCKMHAEGSPIDLIPLLDGLSNSDELDRAGGAGYISSLIDGLHKKSNVPYYAAIVRQKAILRRIAREADKVVNAALKGDILPADLISQTNETFSRLAIEIQQNPDRISRLDQVPTLDHLPEGQITWIVPGLIPESGVVLLAGEPGCYKTWIALALARGISTGGSALGRQANQREILYLDRESPLAVVKERAKILRMMCTPFFRFWGGWEHDPPPLIGDRRLLEIARDRKPVIVFDSFIRFHNADENSAKDMSRVDEFLRELAHAGACPFVIHHTAKNDASRLRGSGDILASVDLSYVISRNHKTGDLCLSSKKNRLGEDFKMVLRPDLENGDIVVTVSEQESNTDRELKVLVEIIKATPGINQSEIMRKSGMPQKRCVDLLKEGLNKRWRAQKGQKNAVEFTIINSAFVLED
jgi:hypothetical protein